jgi:hypothetical protein
MAWCRDDDWQMTDVVLDWPMAAVGIGVALIGRVFVVTVSETIDERRRAAKRAQRPGR